MILNKHPDRLFVNYKRRIDSYGIYNKEELMPHYEAYWGKVEQERVINEVIRKIFVENHIDCCLLDSLIESSNDILLNKDFKFYQDLIDISPLLFKFLPENMKLNIELIGMVNDKLKNKGYSFFTILKYVPEELLENTYLIEKLIKVNGRNLFFIKNKNKRLSLLAVKSDGLSIKYLPKKFHKYNIFYVAAQESNKNAFLYFGGKLFRTGLIRKLIINNLLGYEKIPIKLRNKSIIYSIVSKRSVSLSYLPYFVRNNEEESLNYIKENLGNFNFVSERIKKDKHFLLKLYRVKPELKTFYPIGLSACGLNSKIVEASILLDKWGVANDMYVLKDDTVKLYEKVVFEKTLKKKTLKVVKKTKV